MWRSGKSWCWMKDGSLFSPNSQRLKDRLCKFEVGDVIGVILDLERDFLVFYRNGECLGKVFDLSIESASDEGFYPCVTLTYKDTQVTAKFKNSNIPPVCE